MRPPRGRGAEATRKAKLHPIERDADELVEPPDAWIPVRLEHNECRA